MLAIFFLNFSVLLLDELNSLIAREIVALPSRCDDVLGNGPALLDFFCLRRGSRNLQNITLTEGIPGIVFLEPFPPRRRRGLGIVAVDRVAKQFAEHVDTAIALHRILEGMHRDRTLGDLHLVIARCVLGILVVLTRPVITGNWRKPIGIFFEILNALGPPHRDLAVKEVNGLVADKVLQLEAKTARVDGGANNAPTDHLAGGVSNRGCPTEHMYAAEDFALLASLEQV
mgnify:CR=1 FL=1